MTVRAVWRTTLCACMCALALIATAFAQQKPRDPDSDLLTFFYKDPRLERLTGFAERYQARPTADRWDIYPPVAGFFAAVCKAQPKKFETLIPAEPKPKMAATIIAAVRLCGDAAIAARLGPKIAPLATDPQLNAAFAGLPAKLDDLRVTTPTHLDIFWGASFATGDARHVVPIMNFLSQTADKSELIAIDIAQTVIAMMGGPKEILSQLRGKYGEDNARQVMFSASALWALQSNARQHSFVNQYVTKYIADHPGTPTVKALTTMMPKDKRI